MHSRTTLAMLTVVSSALCGAGTPIASESAALVKRFDNAQLTFYSGEGVGACGDLINSNEFAVALNTQQYGASSQSSLCGQSISITANGKTATARILDECFSCPNDGLDLTPGLFSFFAPLSAGFLIGSWNFLNATIN
ncbi:hypothetical protein BD779DRAFT_1477617 [Infundibulicybe gibba]|nr:hypothetical protein BD779DRAFT_1477617 [Infundibulicybe gibba]